MSSGRAPAARGASTSSGRGRHGAMHLSMLIVVTCWSANIVAGKEAVAGFGAVALAQVRTIGAAALFGAFFLAWPGRPTFHLSRREWAFFILMALSGVTLNQLFFIGGIARTSVAHNGLIIALGPVMVLILASSMRLEELTAQKLAGVVIAFAGVGLLTLSRGGQAGGHSAGDLIQLAATVVFAYYTILMKEGAERFDALTLNTLTFGLGALLMLPFSAPFLWTLKWSHVSRSALWGLAFMIIPGTILPYLLYAYALTGLTASRVAAFNYLQPIMAILLGVWMLAEKVSLATLAAGALILLGVYFSEREPAGGEQVAAKPGQELKFWM